MSAVLLRTEASSSSQIENLTVGAKNLALETIDEGTSDNAAVVVGNVRAMEAALKLGDSMTENNILAMHEALLSAQRGWGKYAGTYRTNLVWVGTDGYSPRGAAHVGPQPELIAGAMADLLEFIKRDDLSVVAQCAIAHAQFETIHPFADGNGRCGRALVHAILRNKGLSRNTTPPVSAGLLHDTEDYFAALTLSVKVMPRRLSDDSHRLVGSPRQAAGNSSMIYANSWMKRVRICAVCVPMPPFGVCCRI